MMRSLCWIFLLGSVATQPAFAQGWPQIFQAIGDGDAEKLSQFFSENVEVALLDNEDLYSKTEAGKLVSEFFTDYPVKNFSEVHRGNSRDNVSQYCIGNLVTDEGTFRVYIYISSEAGESVIQELRFDQG